MKKLDLKGRRPKEKYHSYKGDVGKTAENIINRDFTATAPDEKWTTDVTQFNLPFGKCYLSPILDMYSNEIISYDLSLHPNYEQITNMLDKAFRTHPNVKGLIFHSDQGWQYRMESYHQTLLDKGIIQSMSRKGNCIDNCIMETFFGRMKNEMFYGYESQYETFDQFSQAVDEYIAYYNNVRIQAKTKWMSPVKYRETSISNSVIV
jgi:transposase InsO family protein